MERWLVQRLRNLNTSFKMRQSGKESIIINVSISLVPKKIRNLQKVKHQLQNSTRAIERNIIQYCTSQKQQYENILVLKDMLDT